MIDIDALAAALPGDNPCGDNLEYDPDFLALEVAARGKPEQEFGGTRIEAEPPDWKDIERRALALLERSRDLRPATYLTRALTCNDGLAGLEQSITLIARLVEEHWEHLYPELDPDDEVPAIMRVNTLSALVDDAGLLRDIRHAVFIRAPGFGNVTVRDAQMALGLIETPDDAQSPGLAQIEGMIREVASRGEPNRAADALARTRALDALLDARVGSTDSVDLSPLVRLLFPLADLFSKSVAGERADTAPVTTDPTADAGQAAPAAAPGAAGAGELRTRNDAIRMLDRICEFLERTEPTNPAPLLLRRGQRLMTMNFVDIMREMAPEGMESITKIAGLPNE